LDLSPFPSDEAGGRAVKFVNADGDFQRISINMTPMIDICFQLLLFFIVNMRMVLPEGDFNVSMPLAAPGGSPTVGPGPGQPSPTGITAPELPVTRVRLLADSSGKLVSIVMDKRSIATFKDLGRQIREMAGMDRASPGSAPLLEVEIDSDENLKYEYVIDAVNAISGYVGDDKKSVVRMVEKLRFGTLRKKEPAGKK
jgi:biopolymer transport protein ExbD